MLQCNLWLRLFPVLHGGRQSSWQWWRWLWWRRCRRNETLENNQCLLPAVYLYISARSTPRSWWVEILPAKCSLDTFILCCSTKRSRQKTPSFHKRRATENTYIHWIKWWVRAYAVQWLDGRTVYFLEWCLSAYIRMYVWVCDLLFVRRFTTPKIDQGFKHHYRHMRRTQ